MGLTQCNSLLSHRWPLLKSLGMAQSRNEKTQIIFDLISSDILRIPSPPSQQISKREEMLIAFDAK